MVPLRRQRIQSIVDLVEKCSHNFAAQPTPPSITPDDARLLVEANVVELCRDPPVRRVLGSAFTVVEEKHGALHRRFILWPKRVNDWLAAQGYRAQVDLDTNPFHHVLHKCGGITDLTTSFFQVELPTEWRSLFCFQTTDGSCYQMRVLPMGLSVSPEIMHTLTSTIAGHPTYAQHAQSDVQVNVWIDNIQVSGPRGPVERALQRVKQTATRFHVTLNEEETVVATDYTFAGVRFDHVHHQVSVGPKAHRKLQEESLHDLTLESLERLMGKLWFAARILALPVHHCWWCLKATRRLFARWSRGLIQGDTPLCLPRSAADQLKAWYDRAVANTPRRIHPWPQTKREFDLFTDATLKGWGAVVIDRQTTGAAVAGSRWGTDAQNINGAETRAVACAFPAFAPLLTAGATVHLHIDNTSALSAITKGFARSYATNAELRHYLIGLPYRVAASYIRSADNPADYPSRHPLYQTRMGTGRHGNWDSMKARA